MGWDKSGHSNIKMSDSPNSHPIMTSHTLQIPTVLPRPSTYRSINLPKHGVLCIFFIFHPYGVAKVTGDYNSIIEYHSELCPCHCYFYQYANGRKYASKWDLVGMTKTDRDELVLSKIKYSSIDKIGNLKLPHHHRWFGNLKLPHHHRWYLITRSSYGQATLLGSWRRLPNEYLHELSQFNGQPNHTLRGGLGI